LPRRENLVPDRVDQEVPDRFFVVRGIADDSPGVNGMPDVALVQEGDQPTIEFFLGEPE
jgi:hypothetical protein